MAEIRGRIQELKLKTAEVQEATIQAEKKDAEYSAKIANAEKTCAELVVFDPADLAALRGRYSILTTTHAWKPKELSVGKRTWVFDDAIEVSFTNQGDSFLLSSNVYKPDNKEKVASNNFFNAHTILVYH